MKTVKTEIGIKNKLIVRHRRLDEGNLDGSWFLKFDNTVKAGYIHSHA